MFVFDLQCCSLHPRLSTDGFNCDFAGMMSSALRKTINTLAHNAMCLWVAEHMERLVGVERGTRCWASVMESFVNQRTTNGVERQFYHKIALSLRQRGMEREWRVKKWKKAIISERGHLRSLVNICEISHMERGLIGHELMRKPAQVCFYQSHNPQGVRDKLQPVMRDTLLSFCMLHNWLGATTTTNTK